MGAVQDPSAGLTPLVWRWRWALTALVIGGGVMVSANAESLGVLKLDLGPSQVTESGDGPSDGDGVASRPMASPAQSRSAVAAAPGGNVTGGFLQLASANLGLDWMSEPASNSDDKTADDPPAEPEFASVSSSGGSMDDLSSSSSFSGGDSLANLVGGGGSGAGGVGTGGIGTQIRHASSIAAPGSQDMQAAPKLPDDPLQPVLGAAATGAAPEPETWTTMILGLGLVGAVLRGARRTRTA